MDHIKRVWDQQATQYKSSHAASWKDIYAINLEIETIGKYIQENDNVLDVGCANGYSAFNQLDRKPKKITGIDFSEPMIAYAKQQKDEQYAKHNIEFEVGDVRKLNFPDNQFSVVYTTRVLINLPNWEEQLQGLKECIRVAKKGGTIIICEAFWEPLVKLNALRTVCGLPSLVEHDFNRYIKKQKLASFLEEQKLSFEVIEFSSVYYLGSRFVRDLINDLEDRDNYMNRINSIFSDLEKDYTSKSGLGIQQAYVIKK